MKSFIKFFNNKYLIIFALAVLLFFFFLGLKGIILYQGFIEIGPLKIHFYALSILLAIAISVSLFNYYKNKEASIKKVNTEDLLIFTAIPALIGARIWHVITDFYLYQDNLINIFFVWNGGLSIFGAFLGGVIGASLYSIKNNIKAILVLELGIVFLPLAQVIGRFGNFFNQELYGLETNLPWGWYIQETGKFHHPAFLYEQIGNILLFSLLFYIYKKRGLKGDGLIILVYLLGYSFIRFFVDFFRQDPNIIYDFSVGQVVTLIVFVISLFSLLVLKGAKKHF